MARTIEFFTLRSSLFVLHSSLPKASAFFTFKRVYRILHSSFFTLPLQRRQPFLPLKESIEFFTLRSSLFTSKGVSLFYLFTFFTFI